VLPKVSLETARVLAENVCETVARRAPRATVSIGGAQHRCTDRPNAADMLERARRALRSPRGAGEVTSNGRSTATG
jgi:hypothetical protein